MNVFLPLKGRGGWEHIKLCISPFRCPPKSCTKPFPPWGKNTNDQNQNMSRSQMRQSDLGMLLRSWKTNQQSGQQLVMLPPTTSRKWLRPFSISSTCAWNFSSDVSCMSYSDCVGVRRAYPYKRMERERGFIYIYIYMNLYLVLFSWVLSIWWAFSSRTTLRVEKT